MCLALYVASDKPLPLIPWNESLPDFTVIHLIEEDQKVVAHFSKPCIYFVATKLGCACDFQYGQYDQAEEQEEAEGRSSVRQLSEYLAQETQRVGGLEMFCCMEGDQEKAPTSHAELHPSDFGGEAFTLVEGQWARVLPDAA